MKIGWHTWDPELYNTGAKASAGSAQWTNGIWDWLTKKGHEIYLISPDGDKPLNKNVKHISYGATPMLIKLDVIFFVWRWYMPHSTYPLRNAAYEEQKVLTRLAGRHDIPIVIHDQDLKLNGDNLKIVLYSIKVRNLTVASPELRSPIRWSWAYDKLFYPDFIFPPIDTFPTAQTLATGKLNYMNIERRSPFLSENKLIYIGNRYERYDQALKFMAPFANQYNGVKMYGNWMEEKGNQTPIDETLKDFPNVEFPGRLSQHMVIETLATSDTTIHLFKPEYAENGFITYRWLEAAAAGTPAFIPHPFHFPGIGITDTPLDDMLVINGEGMAEKYEKLTEEQWKKNANQQREFIRSISQPQQWEDIFVHALDKSKSKE